jgi:hypothetical protein
LNPDAGARDRAGRRRCASYQLDDDELPLMAYGNHRIDGVRRIWRNAGHRFRSTIASQIARMPRSAYGFSGIGRYTSTRAAGRAAIARREVN